MHRQRGSISVIAAVTLVVALLAVALAIDIGRIIHERQRLQGAADAAALAGARALASAGEPLNVPAPAQAAAAQNGYTGNLVAENAISVGHLVYQNGLRGFEEGPRLTAVRVETTRSVPRSLVAGDLLSGDVTLRAQAVASQASIASLRVGSSLLSVNTTLLNPVLGGLLGTTLNLDVLSYNGLLGARVSVGDLVDLEPRAGTVEELLDLDTSLADFLRLNARVLQRQGSAAALTLNHLAARTDANLRLTVGELLAVTNDTAALAAALNVFDLLMGSAQLANKDRAVDIELSTAGTLLSSLDLADLDLRLHIVEAPQIAVGPPGPDPLTGDWYTKARTGQVDIQVSLRKQLKLPGVLETSVSADLFLEAATAQAWLETIDPAIPSDPVTRVQLGAHTRLARLGIGHPVGESVTPSALLDATLRVGILPVAQVQATARADVPLGAARPHVLNYDGPFVPSLTEPSTENTQHIGSPLESALASGVSALLANTEIKVDIEVLGALPIGLDVTAVTQSLHGMLDDLLDSLAVGLLTPLFTQLGLQVGGADVTVLSASTGQVQLVK